jgi:hypothetical protein
MSLVDPTASPHTAESGKGSHEKKLARDDTSRDTMRQPPSVSAISNSLWRSGKRSRGSL